MLYLLIFLAVFLLAIVFWQIYRAMNFFKVKQYYSANLLTDGLYLLCIVVVSILYTFYFTDAFIDVFSNIEYYINDATSRLPFVLYSFPLMLLSLNILIEQGLFAYSREFFIGCRSIVVSISSVNIIKTNINKFGRVKIIMSLPVGRNKSMKDIIIRCSRKNYELFYEQVICKK